MHELDKLIEQRKKITAFISELIDMQNKVVSDLITTRKAINALEALKTDYPKSQKISVELKNCDKAIQIETDILRQIETQLPQYLQFVKAIDSLIRGSGLPKDLESLSEPQSGPG